MDPQQPPAQNPIPAPGNTYDFIMQPGAKAKKSLPGMGSPFVVKIIVLVGGVILIGAALYIVGNLLAGAKINTADITTLAQMETEITRIAKTGKDATAPATKNSARTSELTVGSHKRQWVSLLAKDGTELTDEQLALTKDSKIDLQLKAAKQNSTYDLVFTQIMEAQLTEYAQTLQKDYQKAAQKTEKALLKAQYQQTLLLIEQIPK